MKTRAECPRAVVAAIVLLAALAALPAAAEIPGNPLSDAEVACDRAKLRALAARSHLDFAPGGETSVRTLFVTYSNRFGAYEGLVARTDWGDHTLPPAGNAPETLLSFHLDPDVRELLLNPARPTLDQVSLTREVSTSNLVPPGDPAAMVLRIDPTLSPGAAADAGDLVIDNLSEPPGDAAPGFRPADTKPGRGLTVAGLTDPCHTRLTSFDRRVFAILQRVLRFSVEPLAASPGDQVVDLKVIVYRDRTPGVFVAEVVLVLPMTGEIVEPQADRRIRLTLSESGGGIDFLTLEPVAAFPPEGDWRVLAHPVRPGFGDGGPEVTPFGTLPLHDLGGPPPPNVLVDWNALLEGTTWAPRIAPDGSCGLGTPEELAATPRADRSTELLVLAMGDGLTAEQALYDRLVGDLAAIAMDEPDLVDARFYSSFYDGQNLLLTVEETTGQAIADGQYDAWDCLNAHYGSTGIFFADPIPTEIPQLVVVRFSGRYHLETVAPGYADLPGVEGVGPFGPIPPAVGLPFPSICAQELEDETIRYFFEESPSGMVNPFPTYYYESEPGEAPVLRGVHDPFPEVTPPAPPDWLPLVDECHDALRFGDEA